MSRDERAGKPDGKRPRVLERARVGWPPPLRELKDLLYEAYLAAGAPTLDEIAAEVADDDALPGSPSRDRVHRCISAPSLPANQADAVSVAKVLARHAAWNEKDLSDRVRDLWVKARLATGAGRPISEFDDQVVLTDLEVHPALNAGVDNRLGALPTYIPRAHDASLKIIVDAAAAGHSQIAVVVGGSSTGKTRALWEAARQLPHTWRLWHPINPTRPEAVLAELPDVAPQTVVWLNEAQLYLGEDAGPLGERVAAGLRDLLRDETRGPVLVLAALWPQHWDKLTTRTTPDLYAHARELLTGHEIDVPEAFTKPDLDALAAASHADPRLADAAAHAKDGEITQYLAGVPVLISRYRAAPAATRALIHAAMDARRFRAGPDLPLDWLTEAAPGYLTNTQRKTTGTDWEEQALAYVTQECNGIPGILTLVPPTMPSNERNRRPAPSRAPGALARQAQRPHYQLADYLDQYGRRHRADQIPPITFWTAAAHHAHPADLTALGNAAWNRGLYQDACQLLKNATAHGNAHAATTLVDHFHTLHPTDTRPAQWAIAHVTLDGPALADLLRGLREAGADEQVAALLARNPAAHAPIDDPHAVARLLRMLRKAGADEQVAALLARNPAAHVPIDNQWFVYDLLDELREAGAKEQAAALPGPQPCRARPHQ
ncbi:hypothetical protein C3489_37340 [Streptomyces sp. Ru71]|uniref:hypothetical protein n=1 Tax=Streptomyces sp. Ru71 TaxID=2080746 RepID=UPI000CDCEABB|nr:hypothetical protein [Streptomyces sp. Ru71]POX43933.1 hypothetical protein C3489_37340 [Streptomyces sp. Ru71]